MKKMMLMAAFAGLLAFKANNASTWNLDKMHARLGFSITHLAVSEVEGSFKTFEAKITAANDDFSDAVVELTADVNSINTENEQRDTHLKKDDFFDAAKYPTLTYKSTGFKKTAANSYLVSGNLTLKGVTKAVPLQATYATGINPLSKKPIAGFKVTGIVKRSDFGVGTSFASNMLGDEVRLTANIEFIKADPQQ